MKYQIVILACLFAIALTAPQQDDTKAEILRLEAENNGVDKYNFAYDTSNGISRSEAGELKTTEDGAAIVVQGSYAWTAPDGKKYEMVFTADELGYHPTFKLVA
ncbi:cuticular protein 65Au [Cochliomyia hominivorax]